MSNYSNQLRKALLCQGIWVWHRNAFSKILQRVKNLKELICCCQRHLVRFLWFVCSSQICSQVSSTFHPKTAAILIFMKPRFRATGDLDPDLQKTRTTPFLFFHSHISTCMHAVFPFLLLSPKTRKWKVPRMPAQGKYCVH